MRAILFVLTMMLFLSSTLRAQTQQWKDELIAADWKLIPADGVTASIEQVTENNESFLRLHYSFDRGGGFVVLRRLANLDLAENFLLTFDVRSEGPKQNLEIKLLDDAVAPAGGNVWWINRPSYEFSKQWQTITQRRKHIGFAWGPDSKKPLKTIQAVEFGIASASGGKGVVDLRNLRYEARPPARPIGDVRTLVNGKSVAESFTIDRNQWFELDLGALTEIGGFTIETGNVSNSPDLIYELHSDKKLKQLHLPWEPGFGYVCVLPESECKLIRILNTGRNEIVVRKARVHPPEWSDTPNHLIESLAAVLPRGRMPRWANKEQNYWTVCGGLESDAETLIGEDGAIELGRAGPTLEPFIQLDDKTLTWADAKISQHLIDGELPLPQVKWKFDAVPWLTLTITLIEDEGRFLARYELFNTSPDIQDATLLIAVRPFQVLPPSQWLNITGGSTATNSIERHDDGVVVNGTLRARFSIPDFGFGVSRGLTDDLDSVRVFDRKGRHSLQAMGSVGPQAVITFPIAFGPEAKSSVILTLGGENAATASDQDFAAALNRAKTRWHDAVNKVQIQLPKSLQDVEHTIRAQQAYILINQDGHGTQPGSRTYERSWIRDGALTSVAMLRLGNADFAKRFLNWYADFQYENGKIPCVVDKRGSDPVDEHDSTGEYIYAVNTYFAYTGDREFLDRHWPHIRKGVEYLSSLIAQRSTTEYRDAIDIKGAMFGLVPESISHEGYSAKPMHSYWDCYFTSQGLHDAAALALGHGDTQIAAQWTQSAKQFDVNLATSIARTQKFHNIAYIPGCVELGDFDATSTAIGVWPCNVFNTAALAPSLHATLDRYTDFFKKRASGTLNWNDYTPYELRLVGVIATERDPEFALTMLRYFMNDQRPQGWRHWAEVVGLEPRQARFIGDMPHTWCGTEFLNSILNMAVLETASGLEIGAGIPWSIFEPQADDPNPTMRMHGIRTSAGKVNVSIARTSSTEISVSIEIPDQQKSKTASLRLPPTNDWELVDQISPIVTSAGRASTTLRSGVNDLKFRSTTKR